MQKESCNATLVCFPSGCGAKLGPNSQKISKRKSKFVLSKVPRRGCNQVRWLKERLWKKKLKTCSLYLLLRTSSFAAVILTTATGGRVVPASSHKPKTWNKVRLISNSKLCVGVNVSVNICMMNLWCDLSRVFLAVVHRQLGSAAAPTQDRIGWILRLCPSSRHWVRSGRG